jgi:acyl-CoA dehydrogenase
MEKSKKGAISHFAGVNGGEDFKLARMATEVEMGRTFFNALLDDFTKGQDTTMKVSMAKAWLGEMLQRVAYSAL